MAAQSYIERVRDSAVEWMDEMPKKLAASFKVNGRSPFAAVASQQEKLDYYRAQFFNADGTPNQPGREAELQRLGIDGYVRVLNALTADMHAPQPLVQLRASQPAGGKPKVQETLAQKE